MNTSGGHIRRHMGYWFAVGQLNRAKFVSMPASATRGNNLSVYPSRVQCPSGWRPVVIIQRVNLSTLGEKDCQRSTGMAFKGNVR
jgi:hypothetical protein